MAEIKGKRVLRSGCGWLAGKLGSWIRGLCVCVRKGEREDETR